MRFVKSTKAFLAVFLALSLMLQFFSLTYPVEPKNEFSYNIQNYGFIDHDKTDKYIHIDEEKSLFNILSNRQQALAYLPFDADYCENTAENIPWKIYIGDIFENKPDYPSVPDSRNQIKNAVPHYFHGGKYKQNILFLKKIFI